MELLLVDSSSSLCYHDTNDTNVLSLVFSIKRKRYYMKEQILILVKQLIRQRGFSFTIADISSQLCISKKTIYNHFSSKEDIIKHIILDMKNESDKDQIELFNNTEVELIYKLKGLLTMLPSDHDLINAITINQLRRDFPELYTMVGEIYHKGWERFNTVYKVGVEQNMLPPMDLTFFEELYIVAITHLPEVPTMSSYNHKELIIKVVDQLFKGIICLK
jgi:AcrR family transcriptional regulator